MNAKERNGRNGTTLVELVVATSVFTLLTTMVMIAMSGFHSMVNTQASVKELDKAGQNAMMRLADILQSAILPITVNYEMDEYGDRLIDNPNYKWPYFKDIDHLDYGFGGIGPDSKNQGPEWTKSITKGVDNLAFAMAGEDETLSNTDANSRLFIGVKRNNSFYFSDSAEMTTVTLNIADGTTRNVPAVVQGASGSAAPYSGSVVNALVRLKPDSLNSALFEQANLNAYFDWHDLMDPGVSPYTMAFIAVRFRPVMRPGSNVPAVVREEEALRIENGAVLAIDLDGDGEKNGEFNIGSLELVYPGGKFVTRRDDDIVVDTLPQLIIPIAPAKVLRKINRSAGDPAIFKLGDSAAIPKADDDDSILMNISILMADYISLSPRGGQVILVTDPRNRSRTSRWFNTTVAMQNMVRPGS